LTLRRTLSAAPGRAARRRTAATTLRYTAAMLRDARFGGALALAVGLIVSTWIAVHALERIKSDNTIQVTGSAKRRIKSDLIVWRAHVASSGADLRGAYRTLATTVPRVTAYLEKNGIPKAQLVVSAVTTRALHPRDKEGMQLEDVVSGYALQQTIEVRSLELDKVSALARKATELIEEGIPLQSDPPEFHYTKLAELKLQMLAEAARDSRQRAEEIAKATGARIGVVRQARMGVIQINPADSTDVSGEGNNDTTSLDKDIISVVASTFAIE
jgi:uncharacterized protein